MASFRLALGVVAVAVMVGCFGDGEGIGRSSGTAGSVSGQSGMTTDAGEAGSETGGGGEAGTDEPGGGGSTKGGETGQGGRSGAATTGGSVGEAGDSEIAGNPASDGGDAGQSGVQTASGNAGESGALAGGGVTGEAGARVTGGVSGDGGSSPGGGSAGEGNICGGCLVDGDCYADGTVSPGNACRICDVSRDIQDFSDRDGAECDDGVYCTVNDTCSAGQCGGEPRTCPDNGAFCDGVETCDQDTQTCSSPGNPCNPETELCDEEAQCYDPTVGVGPRSCNADGDVTQQNAVGEVLVVADCVDVEAHGVCNDGVCGCEAGLAGDDCGACLLYVNGANASGIEDGATWATAFSTVQAGLSAANAKVAPNGAYGSCELWVAQGTYLPTADTNRAATFQLYAHVAIYGGFAGTEFARSQRDFATYQAILSGDIGTVGDTSDNVRHVVTGATSATIDGFTIRDGDATESTDASGDDRGAGMYNLDASPTVSNCTFSANHAQYGGAMANLSSSPTVSNCLFEANWALYEGSEGPGGGMYNDNSSPAVFNCTFIHNWGEGAGMYNLDASPTVSNCTFSDHNDEWWDVGGGMVNVRSSPTVSSCTFSNNLGFGMVNRSSSSPAVSNCTFTGNGDEHSGGGLINDDSSPTVSSCVFSSNGLFGMYNHSSSSPVVSNCTFTRNGGLDSGAGMLNDNSSPVVSNCTFRGNGGIELGGGMMNTDSSPTVSNCIFEGNGYAYGEGVYIRGGFPIIANSLFLNNYSTGISINAASATVVNCTLFLDDSWETRLVSSYNDSSVTVSNSILWGRDDNQVSFSGDPGVVVSHSIVKGGYPGGIEITDTDPLFVNPTEGDFHLSPGSPAIDAGDGCVAMVPSTDFDSNPRYDIASVDNTGLGAPVDIGAYEFQGGPDDSVVTPPGAGCP